MLTCLWYDDVASDNNAAERAIRPAVMIRKNCYANQSEKGATTMAVMMSVFRTLKLRKVQPIESIFNTLNTVQSNRGSAKNAGSHFRTLNGYFPVSGDKTMKRCFGRTIVILATYLKIVRKIERPQRPHRPVKNMEPQRHHF